MQQELNGKAWNIRQLMLPEGYGLRILITSFLIRFRADRRKYSEIKFINSQE